MCGIIGIIGREDVADRLVDGLRRMEYRGYDSAGVCTVEGGTLIRRRAEGKLGNLVRELAANPAPGTIGIAHTRWATHGAPTTSNAHPHATAEVALVHNGIIENFRALREELTARGRVFESETDTEVVAHLVSEQVESGCSPAEAVTAVLPRLRGAFALAIAFRAFPDLLIGARLGSPLVIGYGEGETYLGSKTVTTDGSGNATLSATGLAATTVGHTITATATDSSGNTSEFSACRSTVPPGLAVSPTTLSLAEGGPGSSFTVALTAVPTDTVTVSLAFDASQVTVSPSTLTFQADTTATIPQTVTLTAVNNSAVEGTQSLDIVLSSVSSNSAYNGLAGGPVAVTLLDNDGAPTLSVADLTVGEPPVGTSSASVTVALTPATPYTVTVHYVTTNGASPAGASGGSSCADGVDFASLSGVLTFNPGETSKAVDVTLCADSASEPGEAFAFNLSSPTGGAIVGRSGTVTITDHQSGSCQTSLTAAVPAGTNRLPVTSSTGCAIGQMIVIDRGLPSQESVVVAGYGSLILDTPTKYAHVAGAGIVEET
jgi:hypothetical protein